MTPSCPRPFSAAASLSAAALLAPALSAQYAIGSGQAAELYRMHCLVCHGAELQGGIGSNLVDGVWRYAETDAELAKVLREGLPDLNMPGYEDILSPEEIRSLVIYMREAELLAEREREAAAQADDEGVIASQAHAFRLEEVLSIEGIIWSISFLPDGEMLLAEKEGKLWHARDGELTGTIKGIPEVTARGQGGLLEVAPHPDHAENGWIYLAFSDPARRGGQDVSMTKIVRGRIEGDRWSDEETIFEAPLDLYIDTSFHFGTRLVFQDGYLFFAIGDRGRQDEAQDLSRVNGKVHRIHDDGRVPADNPFVDREDAFPSIWTYGNRNIQGLDLHPTTGELWATEHGPRGGDELNLIEAGLNYGWPVITHGMNYDGTPITGITEKEGMEQPVLHWTPSIAVCGIDFYEGDRFPAWEGDLFVTGLVTEQLRRLEIEDGKVVEDEIVLRDHGRVRDVASGPDGYLYVSLTESDRRTGRLVRLLPVN
ncbi:MAG: PQQ-dependent sugar dehydrogenase [Opitutales bacterium]